MNSKYKVTKFSSKNFNDTEDLISIEEPLEISLKYKSFNLGTIIFLPLFS